MLCNKQPQTSVIYNNKYISQVWVSGGFAELRIACIWLHICVEFRSTPCSPLFWDQLLILVYIFLMSMERYESKLIHAGTFNIFIVVILVIMSLVESHDQDQSKSDRHEYVAFSSGSHWKIMWKWMWSHNFITGWSKNWKQNSSWPHTY